MVRNVAIAAVALALALGACGGHLRVTQARTGEAPVLAVLGDDLLVAEPDHTVARVGADGAVRWRSDVRGQWLTGGPGATDAVVIGDHDEHYRTPIVRVDLRDGKARSGAAIDWRVGRWARRGDALYDVEGDLGVERIDIATGAVRWKVAGKFSQYDVLLADDAIWLPCPQGVCGLAAADGKPVGTVPGGAWLHATPDGGAIAAGAGSQVRVFDTRTRRQVWASPVRPGETIDKIAAADRWIAVLTGGDGPHGARHVLAVYRRGDGAPVWSHASRPGAYLEYIAAGGDLVAYYDSADTSIHAVHLPDGTGGIVRKLDGAFVISPDATGAAPAVPDGPPTIDGAYVIVTDFDRDFVYRVTPP